jgi:hypothetical protein
MTIGKQGNIAGQTMMAVSEEEFANLARNA